MSRANTQCSEGFLRAWHCANTFGSAIPRSQPYRSTDKCSVSVNFSHPSALPPCVHGLPPTVVKAAVHRSSLAPLVVSARTVSGHSHRDVRDACYLKGRALFAPTFFLTDQESLMLWYPLSPVPISLECRWWFTRHMYSWYSYSGSWICSSG